MVSKLTPSPIIDVRELRVERSNNAVVLNGISWQVEAGQHWAVLGANGSGKTSLLNVLCGYMIPTSGEINVMGRTYGETDWRELRREIGFVSSNLRQRIEDGESGREVVAAGRYAMLNFWGNLTAQDKKLAAEWLEKVGCGALARRPWAVFSQGERQRILIARALISRPKLLILDEPCAGLDPVATARFLDFLAKLAEEPDCPSLVLVTHHVEELLPLFTHCLVLHEGRVLAQGKTARCLHSTTLSQAFGAEVNVSKRQGRWQLKVSIQSGQSSLL